MLLVYIHSLEGPYKLFYIKNLSLASQIWIKLKLNKHIEQMKKPSTSAPLAAKTETSCCSLTNS